MTLPPGRRIVTAHSPLPVDAVPGQEPPVKILIDSEPPNGQIWWGLTPAKEHSDEDVALNPPPLPRTLVVNNGSNCKSTTLVPGQVTAMHRTSSLDYNVITHGQVTLLTPLAPSTPADWPPSSLEKSRPDVQETKVNAGEVVVQRGTLHAWRNDTAEPVRWTCVLTDAEPVLGLPEVWVVEGKDGKGDVRRGKGCDE